MTTTDNRTWLGNLLASEKQHKILVYFLLSVLEAQFCLLLVSTLLRDEYIVRCWPQKFNRRAWWYFSLYAPAVSFVRAWWHLRHLCDHLCILFVLLNDFRFWWVAEARRDGGGKLVHPKLVHAYLHLLAVDKLYFHCCERWDVTYINFHYVRVLLLDLRVGYKTALRKMFFVLFLCLFFLLYHSAHSLPITLCPKFFETCVRLNWKEVFSLNQVVVLVEILLSNRCASYIIINLHIEVETSERDLYHIIFKNSR